MMTDTKLHTLTYRQVASVFREPFILTGYRLPNQSWWFYWRSLFSVHNETVNIWTHLLSSVLILNTVWNLSYTYDLIHDKISWPVIGFALGCFLATSISTVAHLFHTKSMWWHHVLFLVDYSGVNLYVFGTGLVSLYTCSQRDIYTYLESFYLPLNSFLSWLAFHICCRARVNTSSFDKGRHGTIMAVYVAYNVVTLTPIVARYIECLYTPGCSLSYFNHINICFLTTGIEVVFFVSHVPERLAPGWFDIVGHGHSLFHVISTFNMLLQFKAIQVEIRRGSADHTDPSLTNILLAFAVLISAQAMSIVYLRKDIARKVKEDEEKEKQQSNNKTS